MQCLGIIGCVLCRRTVYEVKWEIPVGIPKGGRMMRQDRAKIDDCSWSPGFLCFLVALIAVLCLAGCEHKKSPSDGTDGAEIGGLCDDIFSFLPERGNEMRTVREAEIRSAVIGRLISNLKWAKQSIAQGGKPELAVFANAIERTLEGLTPFQQGLSEGLGVSIRAEDIILSEVDVGKWPDPFNSMEYWREYCEGMCAFGILRSRNCKNHEISILAKDFFRTAQQIPVGCSIIQTGLYRGFLVTRDGDLVVQGFSFYMCLADGSIRPGEFGKQTSYGESVQKLERRARPLLPDISEKTGSIDQSHAFSAQGHIDEFHVFSSEYGRFLVPLPGDANSWTRGGTPPYQDWFAQEYGNTRRMIAINRSSKTGYYILHNRELSLEEDFANHKATGVWCKNSSGCNTRDFKLLASKSVRKMRR
jgi:hypothetical protein